MWDLDERFPEGVARYAGRYGFDCWHDLRSEFFYCVSDGRHPLHHLYTAETVRQMYGFCGQDEPAWLSEPGADLFRANEGLRERFYRTEDTVYTLYVRRTTPEKRLLAEVHGVPLDLAVHLRQGVVRRLLGRQAVCDLMSWGYTHAESRAPQRSELSPEDVLALLQEAKAAAARI